MKTSQSTTFVSISCSPWGSWAVEHSAGACLFHEHFNDLAEALRFATNGNQPDEERIAWYMAENNCNYYHA